MPFPSNTKNAMLAGQDFDAASLHSGFPGTTGANEISGGTPAYARKTISMAAPSGGSRLLSSGVTFDVPACTVKWLGLWKSGTFVMPLVNGGATPRNFIATSSTDLIWSPAHGWSDGQKIVFFGIPPGGLTEGTTYFARDTTTDNFKVTASLAGAAIDLTGPSSFGCIVSAITETVYGSQDTHALTLVTETIAD